MSSTILDITCEEFNNLTRVEKIILLQEKIDLLLREEEEEIKRMRAALEAIKARRRWEGTNGGAGGLMGRLQQLLNN